MACLRKHRAGEEPRMRQQSRYREQSKQRTLGRTEGMTALGLPYPGTMQCAACARQEQAHGSAICVQQRSPWNHAAEPRHLTNGKDPSI